MKINEANIDIIQFYVILLMTKRNYYWTKKFY